jgi:acyl-CoA reductase-like NAD-dependent aldehyde dehydrogenase
MIEDRDLLSIQEVRTKIEKAYSAWLECRTFSQERFDSVVERMAAAARANAKRLADVRSMKTVGFLRELPEEKVVEMGVPRGLVAAGLLRAPAAGGV